MKAIVIALFLVFTLGAFAPILKVNGYVLPKDVDSEEEYTENEEVEENKDDSYPRNSEEEYTENEEVEENKDDSYPRKNMKNDPQWIPGLAKGIIKGNGRVVVGHIHGDHGYGYNLHGKGLWRT